MSTASFHGVKSTLETSSPKTCVFGRFFRSVSTQSRSFSTSNSLSIPAFLKPKARPPQPAKSSTALYLVFAALSILYVASESSFLRYFLFVRSISARLKNRFPPDSRSPLISPFFYHLRIVSGCICSRLAASKSDALSLKSLIFAITLLGYL